MRKLRLRLFGSLEKLGPKALLRYLHTQIIAFANDSKRRPEEAQKPILKRYGLEIALIICVVAMLGMTIVPPIITEFSRWFTYEPVVALDESRWMLYLEQGPTCGSILTENCVGHPTNPALWSSSRHLSDPNYMDVVKPLMGKKFWVGLEISPAEAKLAFEKNAGVLEIGYINGGSRIYVNGVLADMGTGTEFLPAKVQIPMELLARGERVRVGIEIDHDLGSRIPAWFTSMKMSGIYDFESSKMYTAFWSFYGSFYELITAASFFLVATIFFSLWISLPQKMEYFYFATYLFVFSLIQSLTFFPVRYGLNRAIIYKAEFWLMVAEGAIGCLIGASYARLSRIYFFWSLGIAAIVATLAYFKSNNHIELLAFQGELLKYYTPTMFAIGAFFCLSQAYSLQTHGPRNMTLVGWRLRKRRLSGFGALLVLFAVIYHLQNSQSNSTKSVYFQRTIQMTLISMMGIFIFNEYRDRERQFELIHRSHFHDPFGGQSKEVFGYLVSVDLKKSSRLINLTSENKIKNRPLTLWNNMIGQSMAKLGGFKVADEGDGLKIFFESSDSLENLNQVVRAAIQIEVETRVLFTKLENERLIPEESDFYFRAGICFGGLNPIWKDFAAFKSAEWEDALGTSTFKDVQRIMDFEKSLGREKESILTIATHHHLELEEPMFEKTILANIKDVGERSICILSLTQAAARIKTAA